MLRFSDEMLLGLEMLRVSRSICGSALGGYVRLGRVKLGLLLRQRYMALCTL